MLKRLQAELRRINALKTAQKGESQFYTVSIGAHHIRVSCNGVRLQLFDTFEQLYGYLKHLQE